VSAGPVQTPQGITQQMTITFPEFNSVNKLYCVPEQSVAVKSVAVCAQRKTGANKNEAMSKRIFIVLFNKIIGLRTNVGNDFQSGMTGVSPPNQED